MAITTDYSIPQPQANTYYLNDNNLLVEDKTNELAQVIFSGHIQIEERKFPLYNIIIKGKFLITQATDANLDEIKEPTFSLADSKKIIISLENKNKLVRIHEEDHSGEHDYYVDLIYPLKNKAYRVCPYKPSLLTEVEARSKIEKVKLDHLVIAFKVHNRHGVAVLGFDKEEKSRFYWASPQDESIQEIDYLPLENLRNGEQIFRSTNQAVTFKYLLASKQCWLNREEAISFE